MSRVIAVIASMVVVAAVAPPAFAQGKVIPGGQRTVTGVVQVVDEADRRVTVRMSTGELRTLQVPPAAGRLSEVKAGQTVKATYYDNIFLRVKGIDEPEVDTRQTAATAGSGAQPGGTLGIQQTITATIDAIDLNAPSISFKGPRGWSYSSPVKDKNALQQLKVGDRVDISWTEATVVSIVPDAAKK
jgi:hypothetical protein